MFLLGPPQGSRDPGSCRPQGHADVGMARSRLSWQEPLPALASGLVFFFLSQIHPPDPKTGQAYGIMA